MLLEGKTAIIYGGGGSIGVAVARAFVREGATVHLAGRTRERLEAAAASIGDGGGGGAVRVATVDALDQPAVDEHADAVAAAAGIDISMNLVPHDALQGTPMVEMDVEDYVRPVDIAVRTMFLTSRAAARHMIAQGSGVILAFGGYGDPLRGFSLGGLQTAFQAVETMRRQLASELGPHGIRVLTLQTAGVPETIDDDVELRDAITEDTVNRTMLGRAATLADVGNAAVFAASDMARAMTATVLNITCGTVVD